MRVAMVTDTLVVLTVSTITSPSTCVCNLDMDKASKMLDMYFFHLVLHWLNIADAFAAFPIALTVEFGL